MNNISQKIQELKKRVENHPNDSSLKIQLRRLQAELSDRQNMDMVEQPSKQDITNIAIQQIEDVSEVLENKENALLFFYSEKLKEGFTYDKSRACVVFDSGAVYTEDEIRHMHSEDNGTGKNLKCVHSIKKAFPQTRWSGMGEVKQVEQEPDELDMLFKELKG